jgi:alpha 1,3-glucosidase
MRAHSHLDTKRREPWLYDSETTGLIRAAIRRRYELLPLWYTLFFEHERTGAPVMRPLWYHYPKDKASFAIEDEYLLGNITICIIELLIEKINALNYIT